MNILIAPDSFKDSVSANQAGTYLRNGFQKIFPDYTYTVVPMADGGEGTLTAIINATRGEKMKIKVNDPLMRKVNASYGITGDRSTAVIEMANASGIELLDNNERNPWYTSTYGTGELIKAGLDRGCKKIIIGIGGSATNDGGVGMATALGVRFLDSNNRPVPPGGGALDSIDKIDVSELDKRIADIEVLVACDVKNPLTGPEGATLVYSLQKGADIAMANQLDKKLMHLSNQIKKYLGKEVDEVPGSGAAGGLGAGLMTFLDAKLLNGFELIADTIELENKIAEADLIITGEGKIDSQTQYGKTPFGVAQMAKKYNKPVVAVAGTVGYDLGALYENGIDVVFSIMEKPIPLNDALKAAPVLLEHTGERIARMLKIGKSI